MTFSIIFGSTFITTIILLLFIFIIIFSIYITHKMNYHNHKIESMMDLMTSFTKELQDHSFIINNLVSKKITSNIQPNDFISLEKQHNINTKINKIIEVSDDDVDDDDDDDDDDDVDDDDDNDDDDDEDDDDEDDVEDDDEDEDDQENKKIIKKNVNLKGGDNIEFIEKGIEKINNLEKLVFYNDENTFNDEILNQQLHIYNKITLKDNDEEQEKILEEYKINQEEEEEEEQEEEIIIKEEKLIENDEINEDIKIIDACFDEEKNNSIIDYKKMKLDKLKEMVIELKIDDSKKINKMSKKDLIKILEENISIQEEM
jgi:hypothetical protein